MKHTPLADYRIVYFATHGLVAGDVKGLGEPSLALSIPAKPTDEDDGLLKASEVAQLKLNADWVVLSACNTVAGDKPGAEALSGLARAFFYAGARALLVSHWAVASDAATRLTTQAFAVLKADPTLGRAEAMRRTMLAYLNDKSSPENAYPALWGPFAVIGEGGGAATRCPRNARAAPDPIGAEPHLSVRSVARSLPERGCPRRSLAPSAPRSSAMPTMTRWLLARRSMWALVPHAAGRRRRRKIGAEARPWSNLPKSV